MSWLLRHAEDILNKVDQQTNAAFHQQQQQQQAKSAPIYSQVEFVPEAPAVFPSEPPPPPASRTLPPRSSVTPTRRTKKADESDLINYLNSSASLNSNEVKKPARTITSQNKSRADSASSNTTDEPFQAPSRSNSNDLIPSVSPIDTNASRITNHESIASLHAEIQSLTKEKQRQSNELDVYKRQQVHYQQQIAESDALLRDLRVRESDSTAILSAKDSQIMLLRNRLTELEGLLQAQTYQYEQQQNSSTGRLESSDYSQSRLPHVEQELDRQIHENERINNENQQLVEQLKLAEKRHNDERLQLYEQQQQTKQAKSLANQIEQDLNEYKTKAQRILQTKDKLIVKLKEIIQHRSSTPTLPDQYDAETSNIHDDSTLLEVSLVGNPSAASSSSTSSKWASAQYEELLSENELFKQELQARELTIHTLRNELQEAELLINHTDQQSQERANQLADQLKEESARRLLAEQDYRNLKHELTTTNEEFQKQKQVYQSQQGDREREIERLRSQLTSKTINHVRDDELEKRLQTLTESLIQKQAVIEALQTDKSSLSMQLERLEKRLDDYETITAKHSSQNSSRMYSTTSIPMDEHEQYDNLRYRAPLLRETPYDVDLTKKVKRAANELDRLGIRATVFLRRYPIVRLAVLLYVVVLHLWTFILLFTYTPEAHGSRNSLDLKDKL